MSPVIRSLLASSSLLVFFAISPGNLANCQDWTQFRGAHSNGISQASNLPAEFGERKNLRWKIELAGRAWSSPVVIGNQIWLTNAVEHEATGEERKKKMKGASVGGLSAYSRVELFAICLDRQSGAIQHRKLLFTIKDPPLINTLNSFASPTPIVDGDNVILHFGSFGTTCLNRKTGNRVWKNARYQVDHQTGPGSSPLLHDGRLF